MRSTIPVDETGNTYGRLTVLRQSDTVKPGGRLWICQCICGKRKEVNGRKLRDGRIKSCGCLQKQNSLKYVRKFMNKNALDKIDDDIL